MRMNLKPVRDSLAKARPGLRRTQQGKLELARGASIPPDVLAVVEQVSKPGPIAGTDGQKAVAGEVVDAFAKRSASLLRRARDASKSYVTTPLTMAQLFDWCDWVEGGLVMRPTTPADDLVSMFGRVMMNKRDKIEIPIWDFRSFLSRSAPTATTLQAMLCNPPSISPPAQSARKCTIEYCMEDSMSALAVGMHKFEEFREYCRAVQPISLFGQTFDLTDPMSVQALDRAKLMTELRYARHREMVTLLRTFGDTFADEHPELEAVQGDDCAGLLPIGAIDVSPPGEATCQTITDVAANARQVAEKIWVRLKSIKHQIKQDFDGELRPQDFAFAMHADDALCFMWAQVCCNFACANTSININVDPRNLNDAYFALAEQFTQRLAGGRYGFGYVQLPDGTRLDIWATEYDRSNTSDPIIPKGTAYLWVMGWGGNQPNPYALAFLEEDYTDYIAYMNQNSPFPRIRTLGIGNAIEVIPLDGCGDRQVGYSIKLISNAPHLAWTKFTGLCACDESNLGSVLPSMPAVGLITPCTVPEPEGP